MMKTRSSQRGEATAGVAWYGRWMVAVLTAAATMVAFGCQERVVSRKAYSSQQFAGQTTSIAPDVTRAPQKKPKGNLFDDMLKGLGSLVPDFSKKPDSGSEPLTADEIRRLREQMQNNQQPGGSE